MFYADRIPKASGLVYAAAPSDPDKAVDEFVLKVNALLLERPPIESSTAEWETKYEHLITSEAERLRTLVPNILQVLGQRLGAKSDTDRRLDELLKLKHPTVEEALQIQSLLHEQLSESSPPRCAIMFLIGRLGKEAPKEAVNVLLATAPPPERSEDLCLIHSLMTLGPQGYMVINERLSTETDPLKVYFGVMALVAQTVRTDFPMSAGLGKEEDWDRSFPKSLRGLRRLTEKWKKWWTASEGRYTWNAETSLLEAK